MEFTAKSGPMPCPVKGCSGQAATRTAMKVEFWHWHVRDTVVILEEVNLPLPRLPSVWHAGDVTGAEWDAPEHIAVQEGEGAEATAFGSGGGKGDNL